jgi:predicted PurR-regulated permease PerM
MVWGPAAIWLMVSGSITKGLVLVAIGAGVIGLMDNVTRPLLARVGGAELSVFTITLGAIGGIATFGFTGIIIGPLAIEAFSWLIEHLSSTNYEALSENQ